MLFSIVYQLFPNCLACIRLLLILSTIIFISTLFILGIIQDKNKNRREAKHNHPQGEEDRNEEHKLLLLTQCNTIINKHMPDNLCDYVKGAYDKIYGSEGYKYYPATLALPQEKLRKKLKRKVSFSEERNEIEFEI